MNHLQWTTLTLGTLSQYASLLSTVVKTYRGGTQADKNPTLPIHKIHIQEYIHGDQFAIELNYVPSFGSSP